MKETWHDRLRARLEELCWTVAELSRQSGVNQDNCYRYVDGKVDNPRGDTLKKIANAIGVSVEWLRFGIDTPPIEKPNFNIGKTYQAPLVSWGDLEGAILSDRKLRSAWDGVSSLTVPFTPAPDLLFCEITDQTNLGRFNPHDFIGFRESVAPQAGNWVIVYVYALRRFVIGRYAVLEQTGSGDEVIAIEPENPAEGRVRLNSPTEYRYIGKATHHIATLE